MDNSIYVTLSRQLALFRDMDATSNNIANANTTGYDSEHLLFDTYVTHDINSGKRNTLDFANDVSTYRNLDTGSIKATGNQLDVALQGPGYFAVQTPLGVRYTRAGNFQMDGNGTLVTQDGYPVLDDGGQQIAFPDGTTNIEIGSAGNIKTDGLDFATLNVVQFANPQLLERLNSGLYKSNVTPIPADNPQVRQGALETSNVEPVKELTHMMTLTQATTDTAQFIAVIYDLERKTDDAWAQPAT